MANIKISQLPSLGTLSGPDQFPVVSNGTTFNVTANVAQDYMSTYPGGVFTGAVFSATDRVEATGNITGGNIRTAGLISATGNLQAGNLRTSGQISATGNITSGNISTGTAVITTANITTANITTGNITATIVSPLANITNATIDNFLSANAGITGGTITGITDLAVADGGTGRSSLTSAAVLVGAGTSAVNSVSPGTSGNVLTSDGSNWLSTTNTGITAGQTWQNLTGSRASDVTYTNSTGRAIFAVVQVGNQTSGIQVYINGELVVRHFYDVNGGAGQIGYSTGEFMVPPGATYFATAGPLRGWWEYR
jgi:hypothetical protein